MLCAYGCGQEAIHQLKNGKWCCSKHYTQCPILRKKNSDKKKTNYKFPDPKDNPTFFKVSCKYCNEKKAICGIKMHETSCYLNPSNIKLCPVCKKPIKDYKHNVTCSSKCARNYYSEMYKEYGKKDKNLTYTTICFENHKKECIICGENIIVAVHHYDHNPNNNKVENLIPLCPTHHMYMHSKHIYIIKECVDEYQNNFKNK